MTAVPPLTRSYAVLILRAVVVAIAVAWAGPTASQSADRGYEELHQSMEARQPALEGILLDGSQCLGERLDGLLEINSTCAPEARRLAEAENGDRRALNRLMAAELGTSAEQIGRERAQRNLERYRRGVLREVQVSATETTWWDGYPPPPGTATRLLALRYARIHERPDGDSRVVRDNVQQYEAFGVLDSREDTAGGALWFQVTEDQVPKIKPPGWSANPLGWIADTDAIPWRRALVMRFTNPLGREPSLFFRDADDVMRLAELEPNARASRLDAIRVALDRGRAEGGIVAVEPRVGAKAEELAFYPVLDYYARERNRQVRIEGKFARLLEVAARAGDEDRGTGTREVPIDLVFVMDTTNSMKPYLKQVLSASQEFVDRLGGSDDAIRFGFIGYQDKSPGFDYEFHEFTTRTQSLVEFTRTLAGIHARERAFSGDDIPELVFEAVDAALDSGQWREDAVKIILLVGDAPGREDALTVRTLRDKAFTRGIDIFALHIANSKVSAAWDRQTEQQFRDLSSTYDGAYGTSREIPHMLSIDAGDTQFRNELVKRFVETQQAFEAIRAAASGADDSLERAGAGPLTDLIFRQAVLLLPDNNLPSTNIKGWVSDKVLTKPDREALAPMLLVNEVELDELAQRVRELKEIAERALRGEEGTTLDFFDLVERNTRFTLVNPRAVNFRDVFAVPLGIDELPYQSDIMAATREEFENPDRVHDFVRAMSTKLRHYEDLRREYGNPDVWKKLSRGTDERVVGVELNQLP